MQNIYTYDLWEFKITGIVDSPFVTELWRNAQHRVREANEFRSKGSLPRRKLFFLEGTPTEGNVGKIVIETYTSYFNDQDRLSVPCFIFPYG
jgi:hypothetical protein